jgi:hypothetical protein
MRELTIDMSHRGGASLKRSMQHNDGGLVWMRDLNIHVGRNIDHLPIPEVASDQVFRVDTASFQDARLRLVYEQKLLSPS